MTLNRYWYIPAHFLAGVVDSLFLKYSIVIMINSERMRKVIGRTLLPNLAFVMIYWIITKVWILHLLLYVPLVVTQFLVNYYMLLKANSALGKLFTNNVSESSFVDKIIDIAADAVFCNITLVTSTLLYHIFRNIGIFHMICESGYAIIYSMIMGYTISLNVLIESGLKLDSRLFFIENHLIYLIGYGTPMTLGYYMLPLVVYYSLQAVFIPLMIINSKEYFKPRTMPAGTLPVVAFLNKFNKVVFETMSIIIKKMKENV